MIVIRKPTQVEAVAEAANGSALLKAVGRKINDAGTFEWSKDDDNDTKVTLPKHIIEALKTKHVRCAPNYIRAQDVYNLHLKGNTCKEIIAALRGKYSESMIKIDHAAINAADNMMDENAGKQAPPPPLQKRWGKTIILV